MICVADTLFAQSSRLVVVHFAVMDPQEMYFERQVGEQCGVHAINNAVGGQVLLAADMLGVAAEILKIEQKSAKGADVVSVSSDSAEAVHPSSTTPRLTFPIPPIIRVT